MGIHYFVSSTVRLTRHRRNTYLLIRLAQCFFLEILDYLMITQSVYDPKFTRHSSEIYVVLPLY